MLFFRFKAVLFPSLFLDFILFLKGIEGRVDAIQFYYDLTTLPEDGEIITTSTFKGEGISTFDENYRSK